MAVKRVTELFDDRAGTPYSIDGKRDYVRRFLVEVDNQLTSQYEIGNHRSLPGPNSFYTSADGSEYDLLALLTQKTVRVKESDDWQFWIVECRYSTELPQGGGNYGSKNDQGADNPDTENPDVEWDFETRNVAAVEDLDGFPFCNSAGVPFKPAPTDEIPIPVLSISRNELFYDEEIATKYAFALNSDLFLNRSAGQVQCMPIKAKMMFRGKLQFWRVSYRFRFSGRDKNGNPRLWEDYYKMLDEGTHELVDDPDRPGKKKLMPIYEGATPVTTPRLLDGNGRLKTRNDDGTITPVYISFKRFNRMSFVDLIKRGPVGEEHYALLKKLTKKKIGY